MAGLVEIGEVVLTEEQIAQRAAQQAAAQLERQAAQSAVQKSAQLQYPGMTPGSRSLADTMWTGLQRANAAVGVGQAILGAVPGGGITRTQGPHMGERNLQEGGVEGKTGRSGGVMDPDNPTEHLTLRDQARLGEVQQLAISLARYDAELRSESVSQDNVEMYSRRMIAYRYDMEPTGNGQLQQMSYLAVAPTWAGMARQFLQAAYNAGGNSMPAVRPVMIETQAMLDDVDKALERNHLQEEIIEAYPVKNLDVTPPFQMRQAASDYITMVRNRVFPVPVSPAPLEFVEQKDVLVRDGNGQVGVFQAALQTASVQFNRLRERIKNEPAEPEVVDLRTFVREDTPPVQAGQRRTPKKSLFTRAIPSLPTLRAQHPTWSENELTAYRAQMVSPTTGVSIDMSEFDTAPDENTFARPAPAYGTFDEPLPPGRYRVQGFGDNAIEMVEPLVRETPPLAPLSLDEVREVRDAVVSGCQTYGESRKQDTEDRLKRVAFNRAKRKADDELAKFKDSVRHIYSKDKTPHTRARAEWPRTPQFPRTPAARQGLAHARLAAQASADAKKAAAATRAKQAGIAARALLGQPAAVDLPEEPPMFNGRNGAAQGALGRQARASSNMGQLPSELDIESKREFPVTRDAPVTRGAPVIRDATVTRGAPINFADDDTEWNKARDRITPLTSINTFESVNPDYAGILRGGFGRDMEMDPVSTVLLPGGSGPPGGDPPGGGGPGRRVAATWRRSIKKLLSSALQQLIVGLVTAEIVKKLWREGGFSMVAQQLMQDYISYCRNCEPICEPAESRCALTVNCTSVKTSGHRFPGVPTFQTKAYGAYNHKLPSLTLHRRAFANYRRSDPDYTRSLTDEAMDKALDVAVIYAKEQGMQKPTPMAETYASAVDTRVDQSFLLLDPYAELAAIRLRSYNNATSVGSRVPIVDNVPGDLPRTISGQETSSVGMLQSATARHSQYVNIVQQLLH